MDDQAKMHTEVEKKLVKFGILTKAKKWLVARGTRLLQEKYQHQLRHGVGCELHELFAARLSAEQTNRGQRRLQLLDVLVVVFILIQL